MKRSIFLAVMLLPVLSYSQNADTAARSKPVTTAPLLGGINISSMIAPVKAGATTFVIQTPAADIAVPVYKNFRSKHPIFVRAGLRYQGMLLSGEKLIYPGNFHSFTLPVYASYAISRATNISFIGLVSVGSDFKKTIDGNDIMYTAGVRFGFNQNKSFKYGVTLAYISNYAGNYLLPLPDVDWKISKKLSFTAILPARASLKYKISDAQSIGVTTGISGLMYKLNTGPTQQYLHLRQTTAGLMYDLKVNHRLMLNVIAGHTLMQRLETFDVNQKISLNGFGKLKDRKAIISYQQNSFILQAGVSYQF